MSHTLVRRHRQGLAAGVALLALGTDASALSMQPLDPDRERARAPAPADGPVNDLSITVNVLRMLTQDPFLAQSYIHVDTFGGVVTLRGRVPELSLREHAAKLALSAWGVRQVDNQLWVALAQR